jgi:hypothetical protein
VVKEWPALAILWIFALVLWLAFFKPTQCDVERDNGEGCGNPAHGMMALFGATVLMTIVATATFSLQFHVFRNICVEIEWTKTGAYQEVRGLFLCLIGILQYSLISCICKKKIPDSIPAQ